MKSRLGCIIAYPDTGVPWEIQTWLYHCTDPDIDVTSLIQK